MRNGPGGIGYTFETYIGKKEDTFFVPDYKGIEIKTIRISKNTKYIHLLSITPDGDYLFPIKRVLSELGYSDSTNPEWKRFYVSVNAKRYKSIGNNKRIKLFVNYLEEKVELSYYKGDEKQDIGVSWSFEILKERIEFKLSNLALVTAYTKNIKGTEYFNYNSIVFYKLKEFTTFLKLIENGLIEITFKIRTFKEGPKKGKMHDGGTDFSIEYENLELLFTKIDMETI